MTFTPLEPQQRILKHLAAHKDALLFVGMGIGKTAACLRAVANMIVDQEARGALVVAPLRVCNLTWPVETQSWSSFQHLRVANLRTPEGVAAFKQGSAHLYLINYESLPKLIALVDRHYAPDTRIFGDEQRKPLPFDLVIWDESTKAKSHSSKRINAFRKAIPPIRRNWALTGTPAPNSLLDLFAQVRLIDGGKRLGRSFTAFRDAYFTSDYLGFKWEPRPGAAEKIQEKISDITLTLLSSDWVDIPEPVINDIEVPLSGSQMKDYKQFEKDSVLALCGTDKEITAANAAALTSKLLQFTSGAIYDSEKEWHEVGDDKLRALEELSARKKTPLLVACGFRHEQARIRGKFKRAHFFDDAKTPAQQAELLRRWNAGMIDMLVAHPASVGHGLNMQQGGHNLVWFTLTYSQEQYQQMICRLARRGQTQPVTVHRLICPGTIDEVVATVLEQKERGERRLLTALKSAVGCRSKQIDPQVFQTSSSWQKLSASQQTGFSV